jgi:hypothetical protein
MVRRASGKHISEWTVILDIGCTQACYLNPQPALQVGHQQPYLMQLQLQLQSVHEMSLTKTKGNDGVCPRLGDNHPALSQDQ